MIIGVPKEIKNNESRVSATPAAVASAVQAGHTVKVETSAGVASNFPDEAYAEAGAQIVATAAEAWDADLIYKVKEPLKEEYQYFKEDQIIYTYLHLSADKELTQALVDAKAVGIAYETVQIGRNLPLLKPMSEVAGRTAAIEGAHFLQRTKNGMGKLISGVPGVEPVNAVVLGGGTVGTAAIRMLVGMSARVTVLDTNLVRLAELVDIFGNQIETQYSNALNIKNAVLAADLVVSTVLIPGKKAPQLISEEHVKQMKDGAVIVDVAIDQGGSTDLTASNPPTTHDEPTFIKHGVVHYSVANIPGAFPMTSTSALANATTSYLLPIANNGWKEACKMRPELIPGVNVAEGHVTYKNVADDLGYEYKPVEELL
ncbi:MAG: alanine dehydrogenase [Tissierellia bacterium]|nr:alanine dehydrogenase [Tissierellia bacterium]